MKKSLLAKFSLLYFTLLLVLGIILNTFGYSLITGQLLNREKKQLSIYSEHVRDQYFSYAIAKNSMYTPRYLAKLVATSDLPLEVETWILSANGSLIINSGNETYLPNSVNLLDYDSAYLEQYYHEDYRIKGLQTTKFMSVVLPVAHSVSLDGYVIIHYPMKQMEKQFYNIRLLLNFILLFVCFLFLVALFFTWYFTIHPLKQLLSFLASTNKGDYQEPKENKRIDEYGMLQLELSYTAEKLKHLDDYQKNFIANVSHDFRSPLTSIKGYAEAMQDGTIPYELYSKYLSVITFEVDRLTKLTNDLLSLNQFERGKQNLDISSFDINQTIKQTAISFEGTCKEKHIKLKLVFSEDQTLVNADYPRILQVLYNLLDNAIKFSHNESEILITTNEKREKVQISIKDFGIGIPKESLKHIWDRFYKTDLSRGKDKKGTGLGLSITKEIIQAHGEKINVTSTEGAGTEFTFTLPLTTPNSI